MRSVGFWGFGPCLWPGTSTAPGFLQGNMSLIATNRFGIQKATADFFESLYTPCLYPTAVD